MLRRIIFSTLCAAFILFMAVLIRVSYPSDFAPQSVFLAPGTFPVHISEQLEEAHIVHSSFVLHAIIYLRGSGEALVPGDYLFSKRESIFKVASRITSGDFQMEQKRITIPEGSTNEQVADQILAVFPDFDRESFLRDATGKQGYLFPDTYQLLSTTTSEVITKLNDTFNYQVRDLQSEAIGEGKDWNEIVIMASILEEEAGTVEDNRIVAGILWKRISIDMPLQIDVAPQTYEELGLPSIPLSNPGLNTLEAALHPSETPYLYYLTGKDGLMHYAETYEEHQRNIEQYLR
jgi:UPF0755 protein